ncbi:MAG: VTT domain-containing protein [Bryobacteraceae bacterium]
MQLLLIALSTLASEDLACIATGVLIAQGKIGFVPGVLACFFGILGGDLLLFLAGRMFGRALLRRHWVARWLPEPKVQQAADWLSSRGMSVVFLSRFTPGLRLPTYFAAGMLPTRATSFAMYFVLACLAWTPSVIAATVFLGDQLLTSVFRQRSSQGIAFAVAVGTGFVLLRQIRALLTYRGRREFAGFLGRLTRWEFWPPYVAYLPLIPYLLFLAIRHRSLTVFSAVNPGMPDGGFVGESKSAILENLKRGDAPVAAFARLPASLPPAMRLSTVVRFMDEQATGFPVVVKPDVGERGSGVTIVRSAEELERHLENSQCNLIVQRYIAGPEFGIFYVRYPEEEKGRIVSITRKVMAHVVGDGQHTLDELILRDSRAVCMAAAYRRASKRPLTDVPQPGERVELVELGSHCRGAIFLNGGSLYSEALERAIDQAGKAHPGFYLGRFDIRAESEAALTEGRGFHILELNGVSSEPTHIYDPAISLWEAYRTLFAQWRVAYEIGAMNRALGWQPSTTLELLRRAWRPDSCATARGPLPLAVPSTETPRQ